ncbi:hypothetical protein [Paenibacillus sp. Marseille-Q4541]|uniref:hypothetical protein n=1 Tax=Paenibacillus sp. Marseille-Q4541 TaxID=2831522 RepID=UPI001BA8611F|nr:hypothetical protein [Paenibacillus sp. Marseille-Q4541]
MRKEPFKRLRNSAIAVMLIVAGVVTISQIYGGNTAPVTEPFADSKSTVAETLDKHSIQIDPFHFSNFDSAP